jgi:hypothetical protein
MSCDGRIANPLGKSASSSKCVAMSCDGRVANPLGNSSSSSTRKAEKTSMSFIPARTFESRSLQVSTALTADGDVLQIEDEDEAEVLLKTGLPTAGASSDASHPFVSLQAFDALLR